MTIQDDCIVTHNGNTFKISQLTGYRFTINGRPRDLTITRKGRIFEVKNEKETYNLFIRKIEPSIYEISVKQYLFRVNIEDKRTKLMEMFAQADSSLERTVEVRAPMPGLVVGLSVKKGDYVNEGSELLILEAMKMENRVISGSKGVVTSLFVAEGIVVEKEQILLTIQST